MERLTARSPKNGMAYLANRILRWRGRGRKMERLTIRVDDGLDDIYFAVASDPEGAYNIHDLAQYRSENGDLLTFIADRLAEYEDTGLTPEEIAKLKAERDAAMKDIQICVSTCAHGEGCTFISAVTGRPDCLGCDDWEWRGVK